MIIYSAVGRFDPQWLKPAYQDAENVKRLNELTETEKKYLAGLHRRQGNTMLPEFPSNPDFKQLHMAYGKCSLISLRFESISALVECLVVSLWNSTVEPCIIVFAYALKFP